MIQCGLDTMPVVFSGPCRYIDISLRRIQVANISYSPSTMKFRREFLELRSFLWMQRNEIAIAAQEIEIVAYSSKMTNARKFHNVVRYYAAHVRKNVVVMEGRKGSTFPNRGSELFIFEMTVAQAIVLQAKSGHATI